MNKKKPFSVSAMLGFGFGILIVLICIIVSISLYRVSNIIHTLEEINDINSQEQRYAINYRGSVHDRAIAVRDVVLIDSNDKAGLEILLENINRLEKMYKESETMMKEQFISTKLTNADENAILNKIATTQAKTIPLIIQIIEAKLAGDERKAMLGLMEARPLFTQWLKEINEFIDYEEFANNELTQELRESVIWFQTLLTGLLIFGVIFGVIITFVVINGLLRLLGGEPYIASKIVSKIANGDLSQQVTSKKDDSMLYHIAYMQDKLKDIIYQIQKSAVQINSVVDSVSHTSHKASNMANTQNQSSNVVTEKIQNMNKSVIDVSNIAKQTEENSSKTVDMSAKGVETISITAQEIGKITHMISESANSIRGLQQQSIEIGGSASLIAEIADQTNLLALNAAIEAARAGEHGRGFAVVADEVRKLAERTASTTNEISNSIKLIQESIESSVSSIEDIVPQIDKGQTLIMDSVNTLEEIQSQAKDSLEKAKVVASSSEEQKTTMESITSDMNHIASLSQETSQSLSNAGKTIEELKSIADELKQHIDYFKM